MPIDARIALGVQPIKLPNPLAQAAQVAQLQGATSQNMLAQLQLGKAQRENADEMAIRDVLASGVDLTTPAGRNALVQKVTQVSPTKGFALQEQMDKRAKAELDVKKIQSEIDKTTLEQFAVMANADPAGALNWLQQQNPALAAPISSAYRTLQSANGGNNQQAIRELVFSLNPNVRAAATATAPKPNLQSFGGTVGNVRTDPMTGQVLSTETVGPVTMTPSQIQLGEHQKVLELQGQQRIGIEGQRIGLEAERLRREQISQPFEASIDGKNVMVRQDKKTGRVIDPEGKDVTDKIAPKIAGSPMEPGRIAMALQASQDINAFEELVFPKDAKGKRAYDKALVAGMSIPGTSGVGGKARIAYSAIENAVAAKLRGETGAATNPGEIANTAARFRPTILDTAESAKNKIDRLREFMGMTLDQLKESNHISQVTYDRSRESSNAPATEEWTPEKERRYQELKAKQAK